MSETVETDPAELPLDATSSAAACGSVRKLQTPAFIKLNLHERISAIVKKSEFTDVELKNVSSADYIEYDAFIA
jgi:hypothetical protein